MKDYKNNIYIVEGFDGVGKDYYVEHNFPDKDFYRPNHELFDQFLGRQESWVIGCSIFDFLSRLDRTKVEVVINRSIASSLVYSELYNGRLHIHPKLDKLIEFYKNNRHFQEANHIHICHADMASARKIYQMTTQRPDNEEYDIFDGFDEYWKRYSLAETMFSKYYRMLGIKPTYIYNKIEEEDTNAMCTRYNDLTIQTAKDMDLCIGCIEECKSKK